MSKYLIPEKMDRNIIDKMTVHNGCNIREAMQAIGRGALGTALVVDSQNDTFLGLITDGDIRRAILKGHGLESEIDVIDRPESIVATDDMIISEIKDMFGEKVRVIPILDSKKRIVDVVFYDKRMHIPVSEPVFDEKELEYLTECILSGWVSSGGKFVTRFEQLMSDFCGTNYALSCCNGTAALHLALLSCNIGPGDEVIVPALTFIATANAVTYTGAKPVFVDSEPETWNIDPNLIEEAITPKTKAIIPVHLYGHPADMDPILEIARSHNLAVIEDAAEAHGAEYKGRKVGGIGDIGIFSFYGNKIITTGEGGMIVTNNSDFAERIKLFRDHGMSPSKRYWHPVLGYNYRLTNIQAAIGVAQVEKVELIIKAKLDIADWYEKQLGCVKGIICPPKAKWARNVYWLYSILVEEEYGISRDELIKELNSMGIDTRPLFPPIHMQPIYNTGQNLEVAEELASRGLSLPSSSGLQHHEVDRVCRAISTIQNRVIKTR